MSFPCTTRLSFDFLRSRVSISEKATESRLNRIKWGSIP